jgi:hypothetical protein
MTLIWELLGFRAEGKAENGNSELIIPPPQGQHRPKDKLKNQHQQRIAQCVDVAVHVRVGGLLGWSGNSRRVPSVGANGSFCRVARNPATRN